MPHLDRDEQELLEVFETGHLRPAALTREELETYREAARTVTTDRSESSPRGPGAPPARDQPD